MTQQPNKEAWEEEFDEKFTRPAKTTLNRDTCDDCINLKRKGTVNSLGQQMFCSPHHAHERLYDTGTVFSEGEPTVKSIKDFIRQQIETARQEADQRVADIVRELRDFIYKNRTATSSDIIFAKFSKKDLDLLADLLAKIK